MKAAALDSYTQMELVGKTEFDAFHAEVIAPDKSDLEKLSITQLQGAMIKTLSWRVNSGHLVSLSFKHKNE